MDEGGSQAKRTLFIGRLPQTATDEGLEKLFSSIGPTKRCFVVKDRETGKSRGFGYVTFALWSDAAKAKNEIKDFEGRKLNVDFADPKAKKKNEKKPKKVVDAAPLDKPKPKKTIFEESDDEEMEKEEKVQEKEQEEEEPEEEEEQEEEQEEPAKESPKGKKELKKKGESPNESQERKEKNSKKWKLIIRNLSFWCGEDHLKEVFSKFGQVTDVKIPQKPDGKCFGYGFVQLKTYIQAHAAMKEMNAKPIKGRPVAVDWALARDVYMRNKGGTAEKTDSDAEAKGAKKTQDELEKELSDDDESEDSDDSEEEDQENEEEAESEEEEEVSGDSEDDDDDDEDDDDDDDGDDEDDDEEDDDESEDESVQKKGKKQQNTNKNKMSSSMDVNEGRTVFMRNVSFDTVEEDLEDFCAQFGELNYCKLVIDPKMERPRGTAFVQFTSKEDAEKFIEESTKDFQKFTVDGRKIDATLAVDRGKALQLKKPHVSEEKEKDKRNLWLIREGLIRAGTQAAQGLSKADIARRTKIEQLKRQKLKNPNIFVSTTRLCVHNIPKSTDDKALRKICMKAVSDTKSRVTECRIMRDMKNVSAKGSAKSLGFGFVNFGEHKHALEALRYLNNNSAIFGEEKRPIVEFSLENKAALEAKQRRIERHQTKEASMKRHNSQNEGDNKQARQPQRGKHTNKKSKILDIVAPVPTQEGEDRSKIPKGLPSHWGPKIRHKQRQLPAGKPTKKQNKKGQMNLKRPAPSQPAVEQPKKKKKRSKNFEKQDAFDKLVHKYKQKISSAVK